MPMRKLVLVPVNLGSRGAKALAATLSEKVGHKVWRVRPGKVKNRIPFKFRAGIDKLTQIKTFNDAQISSVEYTTDRNVALGWIRDGVPVVCRTLLRASEGRGIVVAETEGQLVPAPLYTKYRKKKKEFRVHVFNGQVIDVQEKRKKQNFEGEHNVRIRNVGNGYVFCRGDVVEPADLRTLALQAVASLDYSIGAVDIGYNERSNQCFVFEVNSTPGMEGTTLENYSNAIAEWYRGQQ